MLQAMLLYAPELIAQDSPFAPMYDEVPVNEDCGSAFIKNLRVAFPDLSEADKARLAALDPGIAALLRACEVDRQPTPGAQAATSSLPGYPQLDLTEEGKACVVHYTLTGADKVANKAYAKLVRANIDAAHSAMTKTLHPPYSDGYAAFDGKLHVYVRALVGGLNGQWFDNAAVSGNKYAGYLDVSNAIDANFGNKWKSKLKGVCYHEYFHGVQSAYNAFSDLALLEGTAVWAGCFYGKDWANVKSYYDAAESVFKTPDEVLWATTYRKYSTSALVFHLTGSFGGPVFLKKYFEKSVANPDAIQLMTAVISEEGSSWDVEYRKYLAGMCAKKLGSLSKNQMPDVMHAGSHSAYGVDPTTGNVHLTGADFYELVAESGAEVASLIATFDTSASNPVGMLLADKKFVPISFSGGRAEVKKFGKSVKKVFLVVTDTTYAGKSTATRSFEYSVVVPWVKATQITALSPITAGGISPIDITFDLSGVYLNQPFPVEVRLTEKSADVIDQASATYLLDDGLAQVQHFYFYSGGAPGSYKFTFEYRVPSDAWSLEQVKSKVSCTVKVNPSTAAADSASPAIHAPGGSVGVAGNL